MNPILNPFKKILSNIDSTLTNNPDQQLIPKHLVENRDLLVSSIWDIYLPLSNILIHKYNQKQLDSSNKKILITGAVGPQGSGKTLLSKMVA